MTLINFPFGWSADLRRGYDGQALSVGRFDYKLAVVSYIESGIFDRASVPAQPQLTAYRAAALAVSGHYLVRAAAVKQSAQLGYHRCGKLLRDLRLHMRAQRARTAELGRKSTLGRCKIYAYPDNYVGAVRPAPFPD